MADTKKRKMIKSIQTRLLSYAPIEKGQKRTADDIIVKNITKGMWEKMCLAIAAGTSTEEALEAIGIPMGQYRMLMRTDESLRQLVLEARNEYDNSLWPESLVEQILVFTADGRTMKWIGKKLKFRPASFNGLRLRDEYVDQCFRQARIIAAEGFVDEILEMSDNMGKDMGTDARGGDKPNPAAVQRDRLRTDNRKWLAGKLIKEVYGDYQKIDQEVNLKVDHSAALDKARRRKEASANRTLQKQVG